MYCITCNHCAVKGCYLVGIFRCIEIEPTFVKGHCRRGTNLHILGKFECASEALEAGLLIDPSNLALKKGLKSAQKEIQKHIEAAEAEGRMQARAALVCDFDATKIARHRAFEILNTTLLQDSTDTLAAKLAASAICTNCSSYVACDGGDLYQVAELLGAAAVLLAREEKALPEAVPDVFLQLLAKVGSWDEDDVANKSNFLETTIHLIDSVAMTASYSPYTLVPKWADTDMVQVLLLFMLDST